MYVCVYIFARKNRRGVHQKCVRYIRCQLTVEEKLSFEELNYGGIEQTSDVGVFSGENIIANYGGS